MRATTEHTSTVDVRQHQPAVVVGEDASVRERVARSLEHSNLRLRSTSAESLTGPVDSGELLIVHTLGLGVRAVGVLRLLKRQHRELRIILVCGEADVRTARRALDGGVNGVVFDEQLEATLPATVAAVLAGQTVVPAELGASVRRQPLSFREKQILGLVVLGLTNSQIGSRLFLAESTVKSHLSSSFAKLGVASRSEAAALILDPEQSLGVGVMQIAEQLMAAGVATG